MTVFHYTMAWLGTIATILTSGLFLEIPGLFFNYGSVAHLVYTIFTELLLIILTLVLCNKMLTRLKILHH